MQFNSPVEELTTAGTDAALGVLCLILILGLAKFRMTHPWKVRLWSWLFGLLAAASFLGAAAHGLDLSASTRNLLWQPLYIALGIVVALFVVGGILDWRGEAAARRMVVGSIAAGILFYAITIFMNGSFWIFIVYEGVAMIAAMTIYVVLAVKRRLPGAWIMTAAIALSILAAVLQTTSLRLTIIWVFNHNGIFHLVQIPALICLGRGLHLGMSSSVDSSGC